MSLYAKYKEIPLLQKLLGAMILGIIGGFAFGPAMVNLDPLGTLFLNLLKMACIPLVVANLIAGIASLDNPSILGRIGLKIMGYYILITIIGAIWGVLGGTPFQPGAGLILQGDYDASNAKFPSMVDAIFGMVPSNIFAALTAAKLDQVVVFSAFAGLAVLMCKPEDKALLFKVASAVSNMFGRMVGIIMGIAPLGIFALVGGVVGKYGEQAIGPAMKLILVLYLCFLVHFCVYMVFLIVFTRQSPVWFLKKSFPLIIAAASTTSSLASIPINLKCADDLGISRSVSGFTIPLGAQISKDGHAIVLTISLLFAAQTVGMTFTVPVLIQAVFIALLLTTGSGGIPGGGLVTITIMLNAFGMPTEAIAFIAGVFFLIDLGNTVLNVYSDLVGTYWVDYSEKRSTKKEAAIASRP